MSRQQFFLYFLALSQLCGCLAIAQSFQPKSIQFKGDPDYTDAELTAAAGIKKGQTLTAADMSARSKQLMDSGIFEKLSYSFDGQVLTFQIVPAKELYPLQLENFPFAADKGLDDSLREQLPLYHGKVPTEGGLLDEVIDQLKKRLAAAGLEATIVASPFVEMKTGKTNAMSFSITSPVVAVGEVKVDGASSAMAEKVSTTARKSIGSAYNTVGSASQLETGLGNLYRELGYLQVAVHATPSAPPVVDSDGMHIPFTVAVVEGSVFHLDAVRLGPDLIVSQKAFDNQSQLHSGEVVSLEKMRAEWQYLGRQYHNKGYLKAVITPTATYDNAKNTVSYDIAAVPGPVYTMGTLKMENASDDLQKAVTAAWPMKPGEPFNEGAIRAMTATHGVNPVLERFFFSHNLRYTLMFHEDVHTVDVNLAFERSH